MLFVEFDFVDMFCYICSMKKTGLIGLGVISKYIIYGLKYSKLLELKAFADIDEKTKEKIKDHKGNFYYDYIEMIRKEKLDYVIIATPPQTHYEIIKKCLNEGVNVIVEKPGVLDLKEWNELVELAKSKSLIFEVMYHWQNGAEVKQFIADYDLSKIKRIKIISNDPYSEDGRTAIADRVGLGGSWIDSGINILSLLKMFLPFKEYKILKVSNVLCENSKIPIASDIKLTIDDVIVDIEIDWRNRINQKTTEVDFIDKKVILNHTMQKIICDNHEKCCSKIERLKTHYRNYFVKFNENIDLEASRKVHEILLRVRDIYEKNQKVYYFNN